MARDVREARGFEIGAQALGRQPVRVRYLRQDAFVALGIRTRLAILAVDQLGDPTQDARARRFADPIAINDEETRARLQHAQDRGVGGGRIGQRPGEMARDRAVETGVGQRVEAFGVAQHAGPVAAAQLGLGARQHRFGEIHAGHGRAQIEQHAANLARPAGEIEDLLACDVAQTFGHHAAPRIRFRAVMDAMAARLIERLGAARPVIADLFLQTPIRAVHGRLASINKAPEPDRVAASSTP